MRLYEKPRASTVSAFTSPSLNFDRRPWIAGQALGVLAEGDTRNLATRGERRKPTPMSNEPDAAANLNKIGVEFSRLQRGGAVPSAQPDKRETVLIENGVLFQHIIADGR